MKISTLLGLGDDVINLSVAELTTHLAPYFPSTRPGPVGNIAAEAASTPVAKTGSLKELMEEQLKAEESSTKNIIKIKR